MPNTADTASTNAPGAQLSVRRDGKGRIFSHIRQGWFVEYPEEIVRQQYVCTLVNNYGFSLTQMDEERETQHGRGAVEADIVIWRTAQEKADAKPPLIVVETKSDNVTINTKDYDQGESYARNTGAPFFVTHNNRETRFWRVKKDRMPGYLEEITDIPGCQRVRQRNRRADKEAQGLQRRRVRGPPPPVPQRHPQPRASRPRRSL